MAQGKKVDSQGNLSTRFVIPSVATAGPRELAVRVNTITADTALGVSSTSTIQALPTALVLVPQNLLQARIVLNPSAILKDGLTNKPVSGRTVSFTAGSQALCSAITDDQGVAACEANLPATLQGVLSLGYTANFSGDIYYTPSTQKGQVIGTQFGTLY